MIPVYNEADTISECLRAVAAQGTKPYEVVVIDNNSTDATAALARQFSFVRVVTEKRQGVVYARRRGFDEARGDIIGSIDADTVVPADWVRTLREAFADDEVHAVAGIVRYRDIAWNRTVNGVDLALRRYFSWAYRGRAPMQGANMAMRRTAWMAVRGCLCTRPGLHEDLDLAVHLGDVGCGAILDERLCVDTSSRQCALDWRSFEVYAAANPRSYGRHGLRVKSMWCAVAVVVALYPLLRILHKGYDEHAQRFSWALVFRGTVATKVNPVTFMD